MKTNTSQLHLFGALTTLTARRVLKRKSTLGFLGIGLFPCLIFLFWSATFAFPDMRPPTRPYGLFEYIHSIYYLTFYMPLLALFLGLGAISDEIESKNITFTLMRPLNRFTIAAGRVAGHYIAAVILICITLTACYFANMVFQVENFLEKTPALFNGMFVLSFGLAAYLGMVALLGTLLKRFAVILALVWLLLDGVFSLAPIGVLKYIGFRYRMLASYAEQLPQLFPSALPVEPGSMILNCIICLVFLAVTCVLMGLRLNFEIVLSDSSK